ncbi:MAG: response regulator, partial [Elusimicrobia bacterium]|nr:response regulator [Elusimicrobiota bacterium]
MAEKSILIIDDDQALVAAIKEGLETLGFRVAAAFDGLQGVLQAHQAKPDAVMLDFNMPAGGGAGVYERLRSSTVTAQT